MLTIHARNVQQALPEAARLFQHHSILRESRVGQVMQLRQPLATCFQKPTERVLFWKIRDANPFFHLMEGLWMLAGRADVAFLTRFNKRMSEFSDDGIRFNGAYGFRWRSYFGRDQIADICEALRRNPDCRRQVLTMWDARNDLESDSRDVPCNTQIYFQISADDKLEMMVTNRSNDLIWGAYGANAVHFSMLQEYVAAKVGVEVGTYHQVSMNTHVYQRHAGLIAALADSSTEPPDQANCLYGYELVRPMPMIVDPEAWDHDLHLFCSTSAVDYPYREPFFRNTVAPMLRAHVRLQASSAPRFADALKELQAVAATDWRLAAEEWVGRRMLKAEQVVA